MTKINGQRPLNNNPITPVTPNKSLASKVTAIFQQFVYKCIPSFIAVKILGKHTFGILDQQDLRKGIDKQRAKEAKKADAYYKKPLPGDNRLDHSTYTDIPRKTPPRKKN